MGTREGSRQVSSLSPSPSSMKPVTVESIATHAAPSGRHSLANNQTSASTSSPARPHPTRHQQRHLTRVAWMKRARSMIIQYVLLWIKKGHWLVAGAPPALPCCRAGTRKKGEIIGSAASVGGRVPQPSSRPASPEANSAYKMEPSRIVSHLTSLCCSLPAEALPRTATPLLVPSSSSPFPPLPPPHS